MPKTQNQTKVYKFGGASLQSPEAVMNVGKIIKDHQNPNQPLFLIVSAMGKMTNQLEHIIRHFYKTKTLEKTHWETFKNFHIGMINQLEIQLDLTVYFESFIQLLEPLKEQTYPFVYDQLVSFGEMMSSHILTQTLFEKFQINCLLVNVKNLIKTDSNFQKAQVNWEKTQENIQNICPENGVVYISQGFIASDEKGFTTTLGREGSDYSAAIFASCLSANSLTIWKDVDGFYNSDPNKNEHAVKYEHISFREAIELAYYGASVVHPKTIQPLKKNGINLYVKSFLDTQKKGTLISNKTELSPKVPAIIVKEKLFLLTISSPDLSFIVEKQLSVLFEYFNKLKISVVLFQNAATSCSFVVPFDEIKIPQLFDLLNDDFHFKYNQEVVLYTVRNYQNKDLEKIYKKGSVILEERNKKTAQILLKK
ncbi:MAG: aspartate kinase [Flavobacteriales bacterium]|jgi:aspartate kinase|nr:aspartate kinase [Flavobacteriales bacterium]